MILRPLGIIFDGRYEAGLELVLHEGVIQEIRPHTGMPDGYVISNAFVNAHSHLEYRSLMGRIQGDDFVTWIGEITRAKRGQSSDDVKESCRIAAAENKATGVAYIGEHSDRPCAAEVLKDQGIKGQVFQEVIDIGGDPESKLKLANERAQDQARFLPTHPNPHALYTVSRETLGRFVDSPISIHFCESTSEREYLQYERGSMHDAFYSAGLPSISPQLSPLDYLASVGLLRPGVQLVHACDLQGDEINRLANSGVSIAHCPRSNFALGCPDAPIRELLDAGLPIGLGLDSAASSGPVDMFAEMRAAEETSLRRGKPVTPEEIWRMATSGGARSLFMQPDEIRVGCRVPLIAIHAPTAHSVDDLIRDGSPQAVFWIEGEGE